MQHAVVQQEQTLEHLGSSEQAQLDPNSSTQTNMDPNSSELTTVAHSEQTQTQSLSSQQTQEHQNSSSILLSEKTQEHPNSPLPAEKTQEHQNTPSTLSEKTQEHSNTPSLPAEQIQPTVEECAQDQLDTEGEEFDVGRLSLLSHIEQGEQLFLCKQYYGAMYHALCILYLIKRMNVEELELPPVDQLDPKLLDTVKLLASRALIEDVFEFRFEETNGINILCQALGEVGEERLAIEVIEEYYAKHELQQKLAPFLVNCSRVKLFVKLKKYVEADQVLKVMAGALDEYNLHQDGVDAKAQWISRLGALIQRSRDKEQMRNTPRSAKSGTQQANGSTPCSPALAIPQTPSPNNLRTQQLSNVASANNTPILQPEPDQVSLTKNSTMEQRQNPNESSVQRVDKPPSPVLISYATFFKIVALVGALFLSYKLLRSQTLRQFIAKLRKSLQEMFTAAFTL